MIALPTVYSEAFVLGAECQSLEGAFERVMHIENIEHRQQLRSDCIRKDCIRNK